VKDLARAVTMALLAAATVVWAADRESQARFVADVEQAKGHLMASREVRALGEAVRAGVHAAHPIQELGQRVFGPIKAADPVLGERVHGLLKQAGRDLEAKVTPAQYAETVAAAITALDEGVRRAVPEATRADPAFQARVLRHLVDAIAEEYEEAIAQGRVVLEIEYQDAWAFYQGLRANYRRWRAQLWPGSPDTLKRMDQHVDAIGRALPSPRAPKTPVPFESVKRELDGLARALDTVASVRGSGR
jgi:hypothetical protein